MKNKTIVFAALALISVIVVVAVVFAATSRNNLSTSSPNTSASNATQPINKEPLPASEVPSDSEVAMEPKAIPAEKGSYIDYSQDVFQNTSSQGKTVLFFAASWCPTCRGLDNDIKNNLSKIPAGVRIVKVDYDSNQQLRNKYGIKVQHTLVQVDNQGEKLKAWLGSSSLDRVIGQLI